ncbi:copper amine oxidase [Cytobacillus depressus]|uniref:Copper amine oxidase n=1 Tax=Cytobacillus depressus TaxID=1602942 RepID=A0A6L3VB67_9BACI|nr:stalk domain-containing protein [Cytobacillus depressus]KAB2336762.1 copper amine oxidase [Cytobacillus depressus]
MGKKGYATLVFFLLTLLLPTFTLADNNYTGLMNNGSATIPIRGVFQSMGVKVDWEQTTKKITLKKDGFHTVLQVGNKQAVVNGKKQQLDTAPYIHNGTTYLPLRFIAEALGANVTWDQSSKIATIKYSGIAIQVKVISNQVTNEKVTSFKKTINGVGVTGIKIPANAGYLPKIVLANGQFGKTQSLAAMAQSNNAVAAINGTFFEAYGGHPDPWNQIINDGEVVHIGNTGSAFGFTKDGSVKLEKLKISIKGATNGSYQHPNNWYAFGLNHLPSKNGNLSYLFTSKWGKVLGFNYGTNIVVANGVVTKISNGGDVSIPPNGNVISLHGSEKYLASRFTIGMKVEYKVSFSNNHGNEVDWSDVVTAVGAGPSLVKDGKVIVDAASEGFTEAKILKQSLSRSAIGVTSQGDILLMNATTTIQKLAQVMQSLGAVQAMNLDGGASSGLYLNGQYLVKPGRGLNNALVFIKE